MSRTFWRARGASHTARASAEPFFCFVIASTLGACGGSGAFQTPFDFPSPDEVAVFYDAAPVEPEDVTPITTELVLSTTLPTIIGSTAAPPGGLAADLERRMQGSMGWSENVTCLASAVKEAQDEGTTVDALVAQWMAQRCGVPGMAHWNWGTFRRDAGAIEAWLRTLEPNHPQYGPGFGLFGVVENDNEVFAVAVGRDFSFDPLPMHAPGRTTVTVTGQMRDRSNDVPVARVTDGPFGSRDCVRDDRLRGTQFRFFCDTNPSDGEAQILVAAGPRNALFTDQSATLLISPSGRISSEFRDALSLADRMERGRTLTSDNLMRSVNEARALAGAPAMNRSPAQTLTVERMANALLRASRARTDDFNKITVGLIAGWDVEEAIVGGDWSASTVPAAVDSALATAWMLRSPGIRSVLLDAETTIYAGVTVSSGRDGVSVIHVGYASAEGFDPDVATDLAYTDFFGRRRAIGRQTNRRVAQSAQDLLRESARRLTNGVTDPDREWDRISPLIGQRYPEGRMYRYVVTSMANLHFPQELIDAESVSVGLSVGLYEPEGSPWKLRVIFLLYNDLVPARDARIDEGLRAAGWVPMDAPFDASFVPTLTDGALAEPTMAQNE